MIGIIICCCYKYINQFNKIYKHWIKNVEKDNMFKLFFLFGNPKINNNIYNETTKILTVKVKDDYESLPKKIYEGINYINLNFPEIKGIYKTDDDIKMKNINNLLSKLKLNLFYGINYSGLYISKVKEGIVSEDKIMKFSNKNINNLPKYDKSHYCYGAGYFISKKSINYICLNKEYMYNQCLEDVCIGTILNKYNIFPIKLKEKYKEVNRID